jgi:hypothetical protein
MTTISRAQFESANACFRRMCAEAEFRRELLGQLVISVEEADRIAPHSWAVSDHGNGFRLNVGPAEAYACINETVTLLLGCTTEQAGVSGVHPSGYSSVPGPQSMFIGSPQEFASVRARLWDAHRAYLHAAALTQGGRPRRCPFARYHSQTLFDAAKDAYHSRAYEFDKPLSGESLEEYLWRHDAHPLSPSPKLATLADEIQCDHTREHLGQGIVITIGASRLKTRGNPYNGYSWQQRLAKYKAMRERMASRSLERAHGPCRLCGDPGVPGTEFVYHDEDYSEDYSWAEPAAFMLCTACHSRVHKRFTQPLAWRTFLAHVRRGGYARDLTRAEIRAEVAAYRRALNAGRTPSELLPLREYAGPVGREWFSNLSLDWSEMMPHPRGS